MAVLRLIGWLQKVDKEGAIKELSRCATVIRVINVLLQDLVLVPVTICLKCP